MRWLREVACALVTVAAGCSGALDPPSLVNKLRVLAVRAQVPLAAPLAGTASDAYPGDSVLLDALVAGIEGDPDGGVAPQQLDYLWYACTPPPGSTSVRDCSVDASQQGALLPPCSEQPTASACSLGSAASALYPVAPEALSESASIYIAVVVATRPDSAGGCLSRLARNEAPGDSCVVALKTLTIQPAGAPRNQNPTVMTFGIGGSPDIHTTPSGLPLGTSLPVAPMFGPPETKSDGMGEVLTFSWFATQKDFDHFHSGFSPEPPGENPANSYTNQNSVPGRVHFWLVLRDDRGGVDWTDGFGDFAAKP